MSGLPDNNPVSMDYYTCHPDLWNGGKTGIVRGSIPLFCSSQQYSITTGRQTLIDQNIGCAVPADIVPFKEDDVRQMLIGRGITHIVSIEGSEGDLNPSGRFCILGLCTEFLGFGRGRFERGNWPNLFAIAGSPQRHRRI